MEKIAEDSKFEHDKEQIQRKSALIFASQIITGLSTVIAGMVIPRVLSIEEYASYKQFLMIFNILFPILSMSLIQGLYYFMPLKDNKKNLLLNTYCFFAIVTALYAAFLVFGGSDLISDYLKNDDLSILLIWQIPYMFFSLVDQCSVVVFNTENKMGFYMLYKIAGSLLTTMIIIGVLILTRELLPVIIACILCKALSSIMGIIFVSFVLPECNAFFSFYIMKELIVFSAPIGLSAMASTFGSQIDQLFISVLYDPDIYAYYSVGASGFPYYSLIISSASMALLPTLRNYLARGDYEHAIQIERGIAARISSLTIPLMCFLFFWSQEFISFMYSYDYVNSTPIFIIYLMQYPIYVFLESPIFVSLGLGKQMLKKTVYSCLLNVVLNFIFIWVFGYYGAAIGTIVGGYLVCFLYTIPLIRKRMGLDEIHIYPALIIVKHIFWGVIAGGITLLLKLIIPYDISKFNNNIIMLIIGAISFLLIYFVYSKTCMKTDYFWVYSILRKIRNRCKKERRDND